MPPRRVSRQSKSFTFKRRTRMILFAIGTTLSLAALIYVSSALSSLKMLEVTSVRISGVESEAEQLAIRASAMEALQGDYLRLFSRANTLIYPKGDIVARIKARLASIADVSTDREGMHALNISVTERDPAALVCTTLPDFNGTDLSLDDPGSCYFSDGNGYLFKKAPSFSGNVYHRYYAPELVAEASSSDAVVGRSATSTSEFKALERFYSAASASGIVSDAILMKSGNEYELYARNPVPASVSSSTASTVVIYFNTLSSLDDQAANLVSFWKHMVEQARTKKKPLQFDSIDVRYGANVFYRENK